MTSQKSPANPNAEQGMNNFAITKGFRSYVNKPEQTDLAPDFLVKGSKNVLIDYANRIISRNGYELYGTAGTAGAVKSSYEWNVSPNKEISLRAFDNTLQFSFDDVYYDLKTTYSNPNFEFDILWHDSEQMAKLVFVNGESYINEWSGGITRVRKGTTTTLTKQGVLSGITYAFVAGTPGLVAPTITDSANLFLDAGFASGDTLNVTGSTLNNRAYTIGSVTAGTITLIISDVLYTEGTGPTIVLEVDGLNWYQAHFTSTGKFMLGGVEYTYTGGQSTDTLTGITPNLPAITAGDLVFQSPVATANPAAIDANFKNDYLGVQYNQLILASKTSNNLFISSGDNYVNFTIPSPRVPFAPGKVKMDNYCTGVARQDETLAFGCGTSAWGEIKYVISQDNANELIRMIPKNVYVGSGPISNSAITPVKKMAVYISREPALGTLSPIDDPNAATNVPISDIIKNDFDSYDFTRAHMKYWKRSLYISLPVEGIVIIYDFTRSLWQPPQTIPVGRFAIINDWLYGHSSVTNETYKLFVGTTDNGVFIPQIARFAYNNGGDRTLVKNLSRYWSDGYITANAELTMTMNFGFDGLLGKKVETILGSNTAIALLPGGVPFGSNAFGVQPLGGGSIVLSGGLPGAGVTMNRFWVTNTASVIDFEEFYVQYEMNTEGGQFALVSHGSNLYDAGTIRVSHTS